MAEPTYRTLRIVLLVLSLLLGVGSLLMILGGKLLMMRILMRPPESEVSTTLLLFMISPLTGQSTSLRAVVTPPCQRGAVACAAQAAR